ncbi:retrovirus-related Pol polyprotein from transposon opus [Danio rerio]|uniref:Retrovirus-related Pol polyprotein from transposon opus n=1 Tax=Danio rerio TaxID=7955 RepID=A0AC58IFB0_DANRE
MPLLVGTNVLRYLVRDFRMSQGKEYLQNMSASVNWMTAYHQCDKVLTPGKQPQYSTPVRLSGRKSVTISKEEKCEVTGVYRLKEFGLNKTMIIDEPLTHQIPGGLVVECKLIQAKLSARNKVKVVIRNVSDHSVTLQPKGVLAECSVVDWIKSVPLFDGTGNSQAKTPLMANILVKTEDPVTVDFGDSPISEELKAHIMGRINREVSSAFAKHDLDVGHVSGATHRIELMEHVPFKERTRRVSPADFDDLKKHLLDLLASEIIEESNSPYASPVVLVRKKNGDLRMVVDYRKLNKLTKRDAYPLPRIEETFTLLSGSKWFSVLDLKSGYYQLEVEESDRPKTAFTTPFGNWQFRRLPQGLTNSPAMFQRTMEKVMAGLNLQEVIAFLDDLIIFSDTLEQHEERLMKVLQRIATFGLKLAPSKCKIFQTSVKYLGHVISAQGIHPDPDKISAVKEWPIPKTVRDLRSFLGFAGYYRRFVEGYSKIVKPLNVLLQGEFSTRRSSSTSYRVRSKLQSLAGRWDDECQIAFDTVIQKLTTAPTLGFADWKLPYIVHTDASVNGLGAALYQVQDGKTKVIAYASRGLSRSEKNYPVHKLEYLALKWAVCEKFHDFLYGAKFTVLTDNNPLVYVLTTAKLDAAGHRWLAALSMYDFEIKYRAGKTNVDADGLSRRPQEPLGDDAETIMIDERIESLLSKAECAAVEFEKFGQEEIKAVCMRQSVFCGMFSSQPGEGDLVEARATSTPAVEMLLCDEDVVPDDLIDPECLPGQTALPSMTRTDWYQLQREDVALRKVIGLLESGNNLSHVERLNESREVNLMLRERHKLRLVDGVLHRMVCDQYGQKYGQLVVPSSFRDRALEGIHDETGHMGYERTLELARARFYWPKMAEYVERKCRTCERCIRRKARAQRGAELVNIKVYAPLELVCIDYLSLEPDSSDTRNILVITDYFTKFSWAFPTKDQTAKTVASVLWENLICHFGFPKRIHSDQGANFESELVKELCTLAGVKSRTTPYHPRGNPVERFNRTLLDLLGTLSDKKKEHWRKYVRPLVHAYNCTRNDATGESPFLLMFGRQPRLPIDLCFGINPKGYNSKTHTHYVTELKQRLRYAYKLAVQNAEKRQLMNKARWDKKVTAASVEVGDRVLIKNVNIRRKHKIADRWESTVYVVVKQPNADIPVYVVRPENGDGSERILHRDLLLPCGFLPVSPTVADEILTVPENCSSRVNTDDLRGDAGVDNFGEILEAESSKSLNPHAPEFNSVLQNVPELSRTLSVSNRQDDEMNTLSVTSVENDIENSCETEIQQDVSSLEEDDDVAVQPDELSVEERDCVVGLRRSKREKKPPNKLNDYVGWKAQCKRQGVTLENQSSQLSQVLEMMQQQMRVQLTQSELLFSLIG